MVGGDYGGALHPVGIGDQKLAERGRAGPETVQSTKGPGQLEPLVLGSHMQFQVTSRGGFLEKEFGNVAHLPSALVKGSRAIGRMTLLKHRLKEEAGNIPPEAGPPGFQADIGFLSPGLPEFLPLGAKVRRRRCRIRSG